MDKLKPIKDRYYLNDLTESQKATFLDIEKWDSDRNSSNSYVIKGSAGTGKSYLANKIIKHIFKKRNKRICVSAPTHKAVRVIENFTGLKGMTIHSLHGLRPNFNADDFDLNNVQFHTIGNIKLQNYDVVFIDEASMIGKSLKKLNDVRSTEFNTKIVYLGDPLQLAPVKEKGISTIFNISNQYTLTEIVRQAKTNPILNILNILRYDVADKSDEFIKYIINNRHNIENGLGYTVVGSQGFVKVLKAYYKKEEYKNNTDFVKIGAFTNNRIQQWNSYVRNSIIKSNEMLVEGDILTGYKTVVDEYLSPVIINSNDYVVTDVESRMTDDNFSVFVVSVKDMLTGVPSYIYIVNHLDESFFNFKKKLYLLHSNARFADTLEKGQLWKIFYNFKDRFLTMIDIPIEYNDGYYSSVKKEIDYGYATTVHKLQGSTINNIVIDMLDIAYYPPKHVTLRYNTANVPNAIDNRNRLLYTCISRASEKAIILNR